jgi:hypothetical protein
VGFDVEFPAIRAAAERLRSADNGTRRFGTEMSTSLGEATDAAGDDPLADTIDNLAEAMQRQADKTANVVEELWQAVDKSEAQYYADDQRAGADIRDVRFGGHDGFR